MLQVLNGKTAAPTAVPFKGGEEKSPYTANFSILRSIVLDGECTFPLLLFDKVESFGSVGFPEGKRVRMWLSPRLDALAPGVSGGMTRKRYTCPEPIGIWLVIRERRAHEGDS